MSEIIVHVGLDVHKESIDVSLDVVCEFIAFMWALHRRIVLNERSMVAA